MTSMTDHESNSIVKMLLVGDSGGGKTGSLSSLVDAGLHLRFLDFDNGLSPIKGYVKDKSKLANVHYLTLRDDFKLVGSKVGTTKASAFQRAMEALDKGTAFGPDIPPLKLWTSRDVLVIDSLSLAAKASFNMVLVANGRGAMPPQQSDYGTAMDNIEKLLDLITSDSIPCHVIVTSHTFADEATGKIHVEALGKKLPPKVPKVFDNMISLSLSAGQRTFKTKKDGLLALKTAVPIKDTYPIDTGMLDIFKDLTGKKDLLA